MATQEQRRARTRERLLDAAAELFAERGVEGSSVDAIAERAGRTSGAVYDHFSGKDGLLFAVLERWVDDVAVVVGAELATTTALDERLAAIWHNVVDPPAGGGRWIELEHELWSYVMRHEPAREHLAKRYAAAWAGIDEAMAAWTGGAKVGAATIGLLLGLEMMRRADPGAVSDDMAIAALRGVVLTSAEAVR